MNSIELLSGTRTGLWLAATAALTGCFWIPYVLDRLARLGVMGVVGNPRPEDPGRQSAWARRARQAHANATENLVVFATLATLAIVSGHGNTPLAVGAAEAYFYARAVHFVVYAAGIPVLRTLAFTAGFCAQVAIALTLFGGGA
jgi:uncharacterized MAPEG superfamily protein